MMEHLPECWYYMDDFGDGERCVCDRLRACEKRVRSEWALKVVDAKQKGFVEGIKEGRRRTSSETKTEMKQSYQEGVAVGRAAGLDAARETVAELHAYDDHGALEPFKPETAVVYRLDALAAIDALLE